jgi:hypothetical protein
MRFGDTHVLAEVGVGINLAFGTIQSFRKWLIERVNDQLDRTAVRIAASLAEIKDSQASNGASARRAEEVARLFKSASGAFEVNFITLAFCAVSILIAYLLCATIWADVECPWQVALVLLLTDIGAVGLWSLLLGSAYMESRASLIQIEQECEAGVAFVKQEFLNKVVVKLPGAIDSLRVPRRFRARRLLWVSAVLIIAIVATMGVATMGGRRLLSSPLTPMDPTSRHLQDIKP